MTETHGVIEVLVFVFGLLTGSFLNVVAHRVPRKESVVFPGSHCPSCERPLRAWELVPILSWLMLRGRCATCKSSIAIRYPLTELITGVLFVLIYWHVTAWPERIAWGAFFALLMAVVGTDLTAMKVPNVLSLPGGIVLTVASGLTGVQTWSHAILGAVTCFAVLYLIHLLSGGKGMGKGDVKLYWSIGAMLGPLYGLESLVLASLSGSLVGIALRLWRRLGRREAIPFVPHIAIGVVAVVFYGHDITTWYVQHLLK